ncbi:sensor histidine kinase, partial [Peribacillus sp. SIMBA_075]
MTFVALPYVEGSTLAGGVLLASPVSGIREMVADLNRTLIVVIAISLPFALLLSLLLAKIHVTRLQRMQKAASMISEGHYQVNLPESNFDEFG